MFRLPLSLRIAARQSLTAWRRSLLIVVLIGLPVSLMAAVMTALDSTVETVEEQNTRELGQMQSWLRSVSSPDPTLAQNPSDPLYIAQEQSAADIGPVSADDLINPTGAVAGDPRAIALTEVSLTVDTPTGDASLDAIAGEVWAEGFEEKFTLEEGRAPNSASEVLVTAHALKRLGVSIGENVTISSPESRTLTVAGTIRQTGVEDNRDVLYGDHTAFGLDPASPPLQFTTYYFPDFSPDWSQIQDLNEQGIIAWSKPVTTNPPPSELVDSRVSETFDPTVSARAGTLGLGAFLTLIEVLLLAGAAFRISAKSEERTLALVASSGATRRQLSTIVAAQGLVLGAIAAIAGTGLGLLLARIFIALTNDGQRYPGFHIPWLLVAGIIGFAILVSWLAAALPARRASRPDLLASLRDVPSPPPTTNRALRGGLILGSTGLIAALAGGALMGSVPPGPFVWTNATYIIGWAALLMALLLLTLTAVIFCPKILQTLATLLGRRNLSLRYAAKDLSRNQSRTIPVMAAIMSTASLAALVLSFAATNRSVEEANYVASAAPSQIIIGLPPGNIEADADVEEVDPAVIAAVLQRSLPAAEVRTLHGLYPAPAATTGTPADGSEAALPGELRPLLPEESTCPFDETRQYRDYVSDRRCALDDTFVQHAGDVPLIWTGTLDDLHFLAGGAAPQEAIDAFQANQPIALNDLFLATDRTVTLTRCVPDITETPTTGNSPAAPNDTACSSTYPAASAGLGSTTSYGVFLPERLGNELAPNTQALRVMAQPPTPLTRERIIELRQAVDSVTPLNNRVALFSEAGPPPYTNWLLTGAAVLAGLLILLTTIVSTQLRRLDGLRSETTLVVLGADRKMIRRIAGWSAALTALTAGTIGTTLGLFTTILATFNRNAPALDAPWTVIVLIIGLPAAAGALTALWVPVKTHEA